MSFVSGRLHIEFVRALLENGSQKPSPRQQSAALMRATLIRQHDAIERLLDNGADVNAKNGYGRTALMEAAFAGHAETVALLLARGASVNARDKDGWTALMEAVSKGHLDSAKILLAGGAHVNAKSKRGWTALKAAARGHAEIACLLKRAGAKQ